MKNSFVQSLLAIAALGLCVGGAVGQPPKKAYDQEVLESFKGLTQPNPRWGPIWLKYAGFLKYELEGLRCTLPGVTGTNQGIGMGTRLVLKGDFEITLNYQVLQEPPAKEVGFARTQFMLELYQSAPLSHSAMFTRMVSPQVGIQFVPRVSLVDNQTRKSEVHFKQFPGSKATGRMRIVRSGTELYFLVAEGDEAEFTFLVKYPYHSADVTGIRIMAVNSGMKADMDVRFTQMRLRADAITHPPEAFLAFDRPQPKPAPPAPPPLVIQEERKYAKEIYQDFRGKKPLIEELKMVGQDHEAMCKSEDEGLRITLPAKRPDKQPVGVALKFPLPGDFEITGSYEMLSSQPAIGLSWPVGIALNLAVKGDYKIFAKLGRFQYANRGGVFVMEGWNKEKSQTQVARSYPAPLKTGKLRLVRVGSMLRYHIADGPGDEFREVYAGEFSGDDVSIVRFAVGGHPVGVDGRLVDLRIRYAPLGPPVPVAFAPVAAPEPGAQPGRTHGPVILLVIGFIVTLLLAGALGVAVVLSQRKRTSEAPTGAGAFVPFACSACGKKLKARTQLAGKKIKCTQCGKPTLVPAPEIP